MVYTILYILGHLRKELPGITRTKTENQKSRGKTHAEIDQRREMLELSNVEFKT